MCKNNGAESRRGDEDKLMITVKCERSKQNNNQPRQKQSILFSLARIQSSQSSMERWTATHKDMPTTTSRVDSANGDRRVQFIAN